MRRINSAGLELLEKCEGLRLVAYPDVVGRWTVGYGHAGPEVKEGMFISRDAAQVLLAHDLEEAQLAVSRLVKVQISENEFSALVCFTFNVGESNLKKSTLLKAINHSDFLTASEEFLKWDRAGGKQIAGLTSRRKAEQALFNS